jgi:hypothetical protein
VTGVALDGFVILSFLEYVCAERWVYRSSEQTALDVFAVKRSLFVGELESGYGRSICSMMRMKSKSLFSDFYTCRGGDRVGLHTFL